LKRKHNRNKIEVIEERSETIEEREEAIKFRAEWSKREQKLLNLEQNG
jgi:hypothetical protein